MHASERQALAGLFVEAARRAAAAIERVRAEAFEVDEKADRSPVTRADREAETAILDYLAETLPDIPAVSEERYSAGERVPTGGRFLLIDPLDGTREFVEGRDAFTVNIALVEDGRPSVGVVHVPARGRLFASHGPDGRPAEIDEAGRARPLGVRRPDPRAPVIVASRSHDPAAGRLAERFAGARFLACGSALKFGVLAAGEADLYPRLAPTCEWDTAAGQAVLEAAGGTLLTLEGAPLVYGRGGEGARNPSFVAGGDRALVERALALIAEDAAAR